ncbi:butyrophilin-like protein 1, partial [Enhydra lutris kenyoni]|uniref:Butyrophilin-like protein 1 n=1 Tax=Enhydra lutris kenyoni TaxID=391180 RepID=A0A2Y9IR69_ENHLU
PEEDGVRVVCMASGWFPKPQVQWRALSGEKFLTFSETQAQDAEGLFTIKATLVVKDSSSGNVTCSVLNPILGQEKAMAIFIPEPFFPQSSPWKLTFMVILTVLMLLLLGVVFYIMREHTAKLKDMQEWEKLHRDKEEDRQIKEEALKATGKFLCHICRRHSGCQLTCFLCCLSDWRKSAYLAGE